MFMLLLFINRKSQTRERKSEKRKINRKKAKEKNETNEERRTKKIEIKHHHQASFQKHVILMLFYSDE